MPLRQYFHPPAIAAGFTAVLIGYTGSAVIIFQAAMSAGASVEQFTGWMMVLGVAMGVTSIGLSWRYKMPIITAWSTPGAALLVTSLGGISLAEAIGAFLFSAVLITLSGVSGWFERAMGRIPLPLAAAMLAGILFQFGVDAFISMQTRLELVLGMFAVYLLAKALIPRYTIILVLITVMPYLSGMSGLIYLVTAMVLGAWFLWYAIELKRDKRPDLPMRMFRFSINYLMVLFAVLLIDHYFKIQIGV